MISEQDFNAGIKLGQLFLLVFGGIMFIQLREWFSFLPRIQHKGLLALQSLTLASLFFWFLPTIGMNTLHSVPEFSVYVCLVMGFLIWKDGEGKRKGN